MGRDAQHNTMETSLVSSRPGGRSRFSKALPAPPPFEKTEEHAQVTLPVRKDSLPSRPALPLKDNNAGRSIPSNMATKVMDAPLPRLPTLSRVNSPPIVVPKRKPVGSGASVKSTTSPPPPPPARSGDISPVESISSLLSAYGTEDSAARYSVDTAATQHSFSEPSPPKLPPKDSLGGGVNNKLDRLDIVSPLALPTPVSSRMDTSQRLSELSRPRGQDDLPPTPPMKDSQRQRPTTPKTQSSKLSNDSPSSLSNQSPSQPQLWRRRSLKAVKPLAVPELKLTSSHGSTASAQQVASTMNNGNHSRPDLEHSVDGAAGDSPILNGFDANSSGQSNKPTIAQTSLPTNPLPKMGNKKSKESLDGFSQYAQEVEDSMGADNYKTSEYSPARLSPEVPEIRRPPTPEYATDETRSNDPMIYSPISPMTPPDDPRPLSVIQEDPEVSTGAGAGAAASHAPPAGPLPGLPPRSSSRVGLGAAPAGSPGRTGPPRAPYAASRSPLGSSSPMTGGDPSSGPRTAPAGLAPSPAIQPSTSAQQQAQAQAHAHARSISANSVPSIQVTDDGDASTIRAATEDEQGPAAQPGDPAHFPMLHHAAKMVPVARGAVLPAAPLRRAQLECFAGHYRFVASRNEDHPIACQSCQIADAGGRFTCAHCAVRICADCRDVLMMNGRDLGKLVEMLKG